jgi:hypothetical protein
VYAYICMYKIVIVELFEGDEEEGREEVRKA